MAPDLPGYYFDADRNRYFKIEQSHTAPLAASWSSDAAKKRRLKDRATKAARKREKLVKNHAKRHGLARDVVASGLLARELGLQRVPELGRGRVYDEVVGAAAWAGGVVGKGCVPFVPSFARERFANMPCFYVSGEDTKTGLGVAFATLDEQMLLGSYIPTDGIGRIQFSPTAPRASGRNLHITTEMVRCPQMSSIRYHKPTHNIILTSREPDHSIGVYLVSPQRYRDADPTRPSWALGENHYQRVTMGRMFGNEWIAHRSTPAPAASNLLCVVGTNNGVLRVLSNESDAWISSSSRPLNGFHVPHEIFDQDFQQGNHNVMLAGGRQPRLWIGDLRVPETEWTYIRHASSIAHVRSVNPHQVLAAGLENSMALYDVRYFSRRPNGERPLLTFPSYRNEAHFQLGWDVCPDLGVVAAAQDDGTVKLFSLRSGIMLRSETMEKVKLETPIRALMFQRMPRERTPSLFVGEGMALQKYSFGTEDMDEEA